MVNAKQRRNQLFMAYSSRLFFLQINCLVRKGVRGLDDFVGPKWTVPVSGGEHLSFALNNMEEAATLHAFSFSFVCTFAYISLIS